MLYRHVFDKISTEFRGVFHVFVNFAGFTWISWLHDRTKYQKPCFKEEIQHRTNLYEPFLPLGIWHSLSVPDKSHS